MASQTYLDIHDASSADLVEPDLQPVRLTLSHDGGASSFLRFLEGKRRPLEVGGEFRPVAVL